MNHGDKPDRSEAASTVTLRALDGEPLADSRIRDMVLAAAGAIAERLGVEVLHLSSTPSSVTATLRAGRIEAIGFAAELRRVTTRWYTEKFGAPTLWGVPRAVSGDDDFGGEDDADEWKRA